MEAHETASDFRTEDGPARVLVADDHPDTRIILRHYLEAMGFDVEEAHDGAEALALIRADHPDAVVLDIQMPQMDGIQVLRALRADVRTHDIPVLALSAHAFAEDVFEINAAGANTYIAKPANPRDVVVAIRALIDK